MSDGTLVILGLRSLSFDPEAPLRWISRFKAQAPAAALILELPAELTAVATELARRVGALGADAVVVEDGWTIRDLRHSLTRPLQLPSRILNWLERYRKRRFTGSVRAQVLHWLSSESDLKPPAGGSPSPVSRTLRKQLTADGLPTPRRIRILGETLPLILRIQGEPKVPIERIALDASQFEAVSTLRRRTSRLFGLPPSSFRDTLGWQWIMHRWAARFCRR